MSTYDLTVTPFSQSVVLVSNTAIFRSPLTGITQVQDRGGLHWKLTLNYGALINADRAVMMSLIAKLRGRANNMRVQIADNPARGAYGGTPLVNGASQTGSSLVIDGATPTVTNWAREGDYFSVTVNGDQELKMITADANSDGGGNVTLAFEPRLRASPADGAALRVAGDSPGPAGVFMLAGSEAGWLSSPGALDKIGAFTLELVEDIAATAS